MSNIAQLVAKFNLSYKNRSRNLIIKNTKSIKVFLLVLLRGGYIHNFSIKKKFINIKLKWIGQKHAFTHIKLVSTGRKKIYFTKNTLYRRKKFFNTGSVFIINTKQGLYYDSECLALGRGGEVIAIIYVLC